MKCVFFNLLLNRFLIRSVSSCYLQLNWVCDRAHELAIGQSFFYVGSVISTITIGLIADRYGRLPAVLLTTFCGGLGDFLTAFVPNMMAFIVTRFISGLSNDTFYMLMFILGAIYSPSILPLT